MLVAAIERLSAEEPDESRAVGAGDAPGVAVGCDCGESGVPSISNPGHLGATWELSGKARGRVAHSVSDGSGQFSFGHSAGDLVGAPAIAGSALAGGMQVREEIVGDDGGLHGGVGDGFGYL